MPGRLRRFAVLATGPVTPVPPGATWPPGPAPAPLGTGTRDIAATDRALVRERLNAALADAGSYEILVGKPNTFAAIVSRVGLAQRILGGE